MILIADSGSTKTDWRLLQKNKEIITYETIGFNPYFVDEYTVLNELNISQLSEIKNNIVELFFYGAGCSSEANCSMMLNVLNTFFENAEVVVGHDMLAAARATCIKNSGMVAILGTGSNSCLYDGNEIVENVAALGYLLGDYGSGADIGKTFIKAFLDKELPLEIEKEFIKEYGLSSSDILDAVYKQPFPNRFLASFNPFVNQWFHQPFIKEMVKNRLRLFFEKNMCKYTGYREQELNFVGSIAFVYQEIIREVASEHEIKVGKIIKQPIDDLVNYHTKY